jgi:quaternary ammonium compound-resistance protein SugE
MMSWLYLIIAGLFEIAWPFSLNPSQMLGHLALGVIIVMVCMAAMRGVPVAGPVGVLFYSDFANDLQLDLVGFIIAGIIGLKLAHGSG